MINNVGTYTTITPIKSISSNTTILTFNGIITNNLINGNNIKIKIDSIRNPLSL